MLIGDRIRLQAEDRARNMRDAAIARLVPLLQDRLDAEHVWIFGSVARGEPSEDSDVDLLVEVGQKKARTSFKDRLRIVVDLRDEAELPFHCDIIAMTADEIRRKLAQGNHFFAVLWREKETIYER